MDIKEFGNIMIEKVKEVLGEEVCVEYRELIKNNGVTYHTIVVKDKAERVAPALYIDNLFEKYLEGADMEFLKRSLLAMYRHSLPSKDLDVDFFKDFSKVSKFLYFKMVNFEKNKKYLEEIPYKQILDLAMVPVCQFESNEIGSGLITITNNHLILWEISSEELWENIMENASKIAPMVCRNLFSYLGEDCLAGIEPSQIPDGIFMVSNRYQVQGSSAVFYNGALKELAEKLEGDVVIVPSSVHETIVMKKPAQREGLVELKRIIDEVNRSVVSPEEILSNNLYIYDSENKCLNIFDEQEEIAEMAN